MGLKTTVLGSDDWMPSKVWAKEPLEKWQILASFLRQLFLPLHIGISKLKVKWHQGFWHWQNIIRILAWGIQIYATYSWCLHADSNQSEQAHTHCMSIFSPWHLFWFDISSNIYCALETFLSHFLFFYFNIFSKADNDKRHGWKRWFVK